MKIYKQINKSNEYARAENSEIVNYLSFKKPKGYLKDLDYLLCKNQNNTRARCSETFNYEHCTRVTDS